LSRSNPTHNPASFFSGVEMLDDYLQFGFTLISDGRRRMFLAIKSI
jgi:hypothetical protein